MIGPQNLGAIIITVVAAPFILILLVIILNAAGSARKATASSRWPVTSGRIISSEAMSHRSLDSDGTHTTIYEPAVVYEYQANGQRYQSKNVNFSAIAGTSSPDWAESIAAKYPAGSSVQVYYNPANPSEATLEHSGSGGSLALIAILGIVEAILIGLVILGLTGHFA